MYRLDRLMRSGIADTLRVVDELRPAGCHLVTISDGFRPRRPAADVVLAVMAWAAKMERLATSERISAARERLAEEGRPWGRPSRFTQRNRAKMHDLRRSGKSIREIAVAMRIPRSSVAYAPRG